MLQKLAWLEGELKRLARKVDGMRGPNLTNRRDGISFAAPTPAPIRPPSTQPRFFFATITDSAQDGSNMRWKYAFTETTKATAGYGGWTTKENGRSGTTTEGPAYNLTETNNGASGVYGNGVDSGNLTGTFDIQPIPDGTKVLIYEVPVAEDGSVEYWIAGYENGIDGECS